MISAPQKPGMKAMQRRLRQLERKHSLLQAALDQIPDAIEIIDRQFNVLYLNRAAAKRTEGGHRRKRTEKCFRAFYGREEPCSYCPAKRTFESGHAGYTLLKNVGKGKDGDGYERLVSIPIAVDGAEPGWVMEIARDVTHEKEIEQQLVDSERLVSLGEMTASIAHEFNNPLGIILGFTQDLLTEVDAADSRFASLKIIEEEVLRCKKVMHDLMEFGRPAPAQFVRTDPEEVVRRSLELVSSQLQQAGIRADIEIRERLPEVWADPRQLQQVLVNLLFNAIEAMPRSGAVTVRAYTKMHGISDSFGDDSRGRSVAIAVQDTGHGIDPRDHAKIFQTFYTTKKKKGMGLGLSVCEGIVKAHGGKIEVESAVGQGATFSVTIPVNRRRRQRHDSD